MGNFFMCLAITALLWGIGRFVPSMVALFLPGMPIVSLVVYLVFLFVGWFLANKISKGNHPNCIRVNLRIFMILEVLGVLEIATMISSLSLSTGRYYADVNGIPYSEYPIRIVLGIVSIAAYIGLCIFLSKKTDKLEAPEESAEPEENKAPEESEKPEENVQRVLATIQYQESCLTVKYTDGTKYTHANFPEPIFRELVSAHNAQTYYEENILGKYPICGI